MTDTGTLSGVTLVRKVELERILQVSGQTISNYIKEGLPVQGRGQSARFPLADCVKWVQMNEVRKALKANTKPDADDDDALERRLKLAKVQMEELKLAELSGQMVRVDDSTKAISAELERVRVKLLAIPSVWGPQLLGLKDVPDAVDQLNDLVYVLMEELSSEPVDDDGSDDDEVNANDD